MSIQLANRNPQNGSATPVVAALRILPTHVLVLGWMMLVAVGMAILIQYSTQPGAADVVRSLPKASTVELAAEGLTIVVVLHPHCPCSRATLESLARLLAKTPSNPQLNFVFVCPPGYDAEWAHTDLWRFAKRLSPQTPLLDNDAVEATRLGARTSGHVLVFNSDGATLFSGGITNGRGHEGDSVGGASLLRVLQHPGKSGELQEHFVYGCELGFDAE